MIVGDADADSEEEDRKLKKTFRGKQTTVQSQI